MIAHIDLQIVTTLSSSSSSTLPCSLCGAHNMLHTHSLPEKYIGRRKYAWCPIHQEIDNISSRKRNLFLLCSVQKPKTFLVFMTLFPIINYATSWILYVFSGLSHDLCELYACRLCKCRSIHPYSVWNVIGSKCYNCRKNLISSQNWLEALWSTIFELFSFILKVNTWYLINSIH